MFKNVILTTFSVLKFEILSTSNFWQYNIGNKIAAIKKKIHYLNISGELKKSEQNFWN